ncbi:uncharacterized protein TNCV_2236021 [Trichonephila clavipes]|nr:uncharacterized protein TNCV_2236021 [Trichonephila clavipes]
MPSEAPVDRREGIDGVQFIGQAYPTNALLDSSPNDIPIDVVCHRYTLNMQVSSGTKNNFSLSEPSCTTITVSFNGVLLMLKRADETGLMLAPSVSFGNNCQIPVLIQRCNSGATSDVSSTHITIILESLPKPGDDTLGDSKFLGYFQLGTSTFQSSNNSTT